MKKLSEVNKKIQRKIKNKRGIAQTKENMSYLNKGQ